MQSQSKEKIYKQKSEIPPKMKDSNKEPKSKFIKVSCSKCKNNQIIFGKPSSVVNCTVCGKTLAEPNGGKGTIKARILEVLS